MRTVGLIFDEVLNENEVISPDELSKEDVIDFDSMKVDELKAFALQSGIELPQGAKKQEILSLIKDSIEEYSGGDA
ncbi:hypothetical protein [Ruminococcus flavefaciens]|uniref:hypothetical protein n=1 Tax=Ruminococcus flavefaciens TaxID=1265 RepID=UPI0026EC20FB|nr:hypothetical protein [Ruminococcus flavefaciens]